MHHALAILLSVFPQRRKGIFPNAKKLLEGEKDNANNTCLHTKKENEACAQPYDNQWEFPRNRLKLSGNIQLTYILHLE